MMSGAQKSRPEFCGTASAAHEGALLTARGPDSQTRKSFEWYEGRPRPVQKTQYSSLHLTIVEGSCARTERVAAGCKSAPASSAACMGWEQAATASQSASVLGRVNKRDGE